MSTPVPGADSLLRVNLADEMRSSYLDYAMSVIIGRALPDVRDGLKPVHRRVLYAMHDSGLAHNKPHRKSAKVVGEVLGNYHPHGDSAVYDTIVRMAQDFSMRYVLINGQGNFGSIDGDSAAAARYTEVKMTPIASALLRDIEKDTVEFIPTYDSSATEPTVLPATFPHLLVNGSSGIAVGMATNIPPHNLGETVRATIALIDDPELDVDALMQYLPAPDFPTGGLIIGTAGVRAAYSTGHGRVVMRGLANIEGEGNNQSIVISELPYQVNKARLLQQMAELRRDKKLSGIRDPRDESDKDGIRIVVELQRGENAEVILNNLYKQTQLQSSFSVNMVAIDDGRPCTMNLHHILQCFIRHRRDVIVRRTKFLLQKSRARAHVLEGLAVALANIDDIVTLIKAAADPATARGQLMQRDWQPGVAATLLQRAGGNISRPDDMLPEHGLSASGYRLSAVQAKAILEMSLQRLTGLEQDKIINEYSQLIDTIRDLLDIMAKPERIKQIMRQELEQIEQQFGDPRRSRIEIDMGDLSMEDLIAPEEVVVSLSDIGYARIQSLQEYREQKRGGKGRTFNKRSGEDPMAQVFMANTHDHLLCFSSRGRLYWLRVYQLPRTSPGARGKPVVNLLPLQGKEKITAILPVAEFSEDRHVVMATCSGTVKKLPLKAFSKPRASGLIAISLREGDDLIGARLTDGSSHIMLFSDSGSVVRFAETDIRSTGRQSIGVRGMRLAQGQQVITMMVVPKDAEGSVLTATSAGYGKRTPVADYPCRRRGGKGVMSIRTTVKVAGAILVNDEDGALFVNDNGRMVRISTATVSRLGRTTQGVRLIRLGKGESLARIARIAWSEDEQDEQLEDGEQQKQLQGQEQQVDAIAAGQTEESGGETGGDDSQD